MFRLRVPNPCQPPRPTFAIYTLNLCVTSDYQSSSNSVILIVVLVYVITLIVIACMFCCPVIICVGAVTTCLVCSEQSATEKKNIKAKREVRKTMMNAPLSEDIFLFFPKAVEASKVQQLTSLENAFKSMEMQAQSVSEQQAPVVTTQVVEAKMDSVPSNSIPLNEPVSTQDTIQM